MADHIKIRPATGNWSSNALELIEGDYPAVIYFPREDIAMEFLDTSEKSTNCPHKGDASYFSIVTKSTVLHDAAWSYENPADDVADIKDYLAFHATDRVTIEKI